MTTRLVPGAEARSNDVSRRIASASPFDADRAWTRFASGNWDPRSLRLNFEFDVECYEAELAAKLHEWMMQKRQRARQVTLAQADGRSLPVRLRDGVARLLTPYL